MIKCPHEDCKAWEECNLVDTQEKYRYAKETRFICKDCGAVSCFFCGDPVHKLCEACKEARLE